MGFMRVWMHREAVTITAANLSVYGHSGSTDLITSIRFIGIPFLLFSLSLTFHPLHNQFIHIMSDYGNYGSSSSMVRYYWRISNTEKKQCSAVGDYVRTWTGD
jgi:hypothetical protein